MSAGPWVLVSICFHLSFKNIHIKFSPAVSSDLLQTPLGRSPSIITLYFSVAICFLALITQFCPLLWFYNISLEELIHLCIFGWSTVKSTFPVISTQKWSTYWQNAFFTRCDETNEMYLSIGGWWWYPGGRKRSIGYRDSDINVLILIFLIHTHIFTTRIRI